jgi:prevent-host-death family protein
VGDAGVLMVGLSSVGARPRLRYVRSLTEIAVRELRNHTADVLRRVQDGEQVTITSRGRAVAELIPVRTARRQPIARAELVRRLALAHADSGLRDDLAALAGDTTDDLGPGS